MLASLTQARSFPGAPHTRTRDRLGGLLSAAESIAAHYLPDNRPLKDTMSPTRIMIIRHAEEHEVDGITSEGRADAQSLTVRGWQRAGALVPFFCSGKAGLPMPDTIFASGIAPGSESRRPQQTVAPLHAVLREKGSVSYSEAFAKPDTNALMAEVMTRSGIVLIAWNHSRIPECVAALPNPPQVPEEWARDRYDLVWVLDPTNGGWTFNQIPQRLLAGDAAA